MERSPGRVQGQDWRPGALGIQRGWCLPWESLASAAGQHRALPSPACCWLHTLLFTAVKGQ